MAVGTMEGEPTHAPATHASVAQSRSRAQSPPMLQRSHAPPPQSTSVSLPFCWPSPHVTAVGMPVGTTEGEPTHAPATHTSVAQSRSRAQSLPMLQGSQTPPPQSTSVSFPFCRLSSHVAVVGASVRTADGVDDGAGIGDGVGRPLGNGVVGLLVGTADGAAEMVGTTVGWPKISPAPSTQKWSENGAAASVK